MRGPEWAGCELVKQDPALWSKPEHPWWTLIDRLLAVGAVHDDLRMQDPGALHTLLNPVGRRIQHVRHHGPDSGEMAAAALVADDLIRATAKPGQPVSSAQRPVLLRQVSDGLTLAGLTPARVQAERASRSGGPDRGTARPATGARQRRRHHPHVARSRGQAACSCKVSS